MLVAVAVSAGCAPSSPVPGALSPAPPGPTPAAKARQTLAEGRFAPATPAIHVLLWGEPEAGVERQVRQAQEAGFAWVKQRFEWRFIEPHQKGAYEWNEPDRLVRLFEQAGLNVIARLDNQPKWATREPLFPESSPPDNLQDWTDFVGAVAARYKGRIKAYEIWNEPNLAREWGNKRPDPKAYVALLKAAFSAIKQADPEALVLSAGLSPTTDKSERAMPPAEYLEAMYQAGAAAAFDLLGAHAAGFKAPPDADPEEVARNPQLTNQDPSPDELKRVYAFRYVETLRGIMEKHGDGRKQVAILEMGWTSDLRPNSPYRWHAVSEDEKGRYLVGAFEHARQNWAAWIGPMTVIYLAHRAWTPRDEQYWWSITNPDGTPRPAYLTLKRLLIGTSQGR